MEKTLIERLKAKFGAKVVDEAMKEDEKKEPPKKDDAKDAAAYDELVQICKDLGAKIDAMGKGKDEKKEEKKEEKKDPPPAADEDKEKKEEKAKDDASLEDRLSALEAAVKKLLESKVGDEEEEEEKAKDDDFEESEMTGDAARAEILAPGVKAAKGEDLRKKALEASYKTAEGKAVLDNLGGGKKPTFDSAEQVSTLFVAASEILKANRGTGLERTKNPKAFSTGDSTAEEMTPEKLNEINEAHWAKK